MKLCRETKITEVDKIPRRSDRYEIIGVIYDIRESDLVVNLRKNGSDNAYH